MRVGIVMEDESGMDGTVCAHFGQSAFFLIADIDGGKREVSGFRVVPNGASHGGGGCVAVDEMLKHDVTHVIAGGMGGGAQQKFANAGVEVFGYSGKVRDALRDFLASGLGGLSACSDHGGGCHH